MISPAGQSARTLFEDGVDRIVAQDFIKAFALFKVSLSRAREVGDNDLIEANLDGLIEASEALNLLDEIHQYSQELAELVQLREVASMTVEEVFKKSVALLVNKDFEKSFELFKIALGWAQVKGNEELIEACLDGLVEVTEALNLDDELDDYIDEREKLTGETVVVEPKPARKSVEEDLDANLCVVCLVEERAFVILPCGHVCACEECSGQLETCPLCRAAVASVLKVFF